MQFCVKLTPQDKCNQSLKLAILPSSHTAFMLHIREALGSDLRPFGYPVRCFMIFLVVPLILNLGTGRK
jgi:hypothetical protein